ncbi:hypothetical protein QR685DRAFT_525896 [Neurospora intermedia]|uniref:Secreted protein n=1 Tax=Neurospora intermedia TaxID=5142 RepID=A0ABR3DH93_NEUIN
MVWYSTVVVVIQIMVLLSTHGENLVVVFCWFGEVGVRRFVESEALSYDRREDLTRGGVAEDDHVRGPRMRSWRKERRNGGTTASTTVLGGGSGYGSPDRWGLVSTNDKRKCGQQCE